MPNVYITRCLHVDGGDWNASHYKNTEFDAQARTYLGAAEVAAQRRATKEMAGLLLRDTPVITDYFISYVTASSSKVKNYVPEGLSHIRLAKVEPGASDDIRRAGGGDIRLRRPPTSRSDGR